MKNTADLGESGQMTSQMEMTQQPDMGFRLPPPYTVDHAVYPTWGANNGFNGPNGSNATLNLFHQALGNNETFVLAPIGRLGITTRTIIVQLRDTAQRPLMSIMTTPGQNISRGRSHDNSIRVGSVIQMTNASGQTLLTARENGEVCAVESQVIKFTNFVEKKLVDHNIVW